MQKIALITGATSGIGLAIAKTFANNGIDLILCGRNTSQLEKIDKELSIIVKVTCLNFDVRNKSEVEESFNSLDSNWKF